MGILDFLKKKKPEEKSWSSSIEVPNAPPTSEELPEVKSPEKPIKSVDVPASAVDDIEKKAINEQQEVLDERDELKLHKSIFVSLESYKDMVDEIALMNNLVKENEDILIRVDDFKEDEDKEYKKWESQLKDIQKKLIFADKTLFGR